jgi:hypothetical protein
VTPAVYAAGNAVVAALLLGRERLVVQQPLVVALAAVGVCVAENSLARDTPWLTVDPRTSLPLVGLLLCGAGVFFPLYRSRVLARSMAAIRKDQEIYRQAWERLLEDEEQRGRLTELKEAVEALGRHALRKRVRQGRRYRTPLDGQIARVGSGAWEDESAWSSSKRSSRHSRRLLSDLLTFSALPRSPADASPPRSPEPRSPEPRLDSPPLHLPESLMEHQGRPRSSSALALAVLERHNSSRSSASVLAHALLERNNSSRSGTARTSSAGVAAAESASRRWSMSGLGGRTSLARSGRALDSLRTGSHDRDSNLPLTLDSLYAQAAAAQVPFLSRC